MVRVVLARRRALVVMGPVVPGQLVDFDVTPAVTGDGTYDFALVNGSSDCADYRSKEGGSPPKLVVTLAGNAPAVELRVRCPAACGWVVPKVACSRDRRTTPDRIATPAHD